MQKASHSCKEGVRYSLVVIDMPPLHSTAYQGHRLQPQNGMEWGQREEVIQLTAIYAVFGLLLLYVAWKILMEVLQQTDVPELPLSVEETNPYLGPCIPDYD